MTRWTVWGSLALLGGLALSWQGCNKFRKTSDPVLAKVGHEAVTQKELTALAEFLFKDAAMAQQFISGDANKARRGQAVEQIAMSRAMVHYGKLQGVDKDVRYRLLSEQALAQATMQLLIEKRASKSEPTDVELKKLYDEISAEQKAAGQDKGLPEFEVVKAQLPTLWKQRQSQKLVDALLKEIKAAVPISYSEGYQPIDVSLALPGKAAPEAGKTPEAATKKTPAPKPSK